MKNVKENIMRFVFILAACVSIAAVALICIFLFANGIPAIAKIGPLKFLGGPTWTPNQEIFGIFTSSILLGMMILPTIIEVSEAQIRAVPNSYYEGSLALGATHERSVYFAMLPAAKSGIMAGVILGIGRAIGETMAVVMIAGNQAVLPKSLVSGVRTMTANIVLEMGYATDLHREALIATGVVLFVFILVINVCFSLVKKGRD